MVVWWGGGMVVWWYGGMVVRVVWGGGMLGWGGMKHGGKGSRREVRGMVA